MKTYELTSLINPELTKEQINELFLKIDSILNENGGILVENKKQGIVDLEYKIKNKKKSFLSVIKFQMEPEKQKIFRQKLKEIPEILRSAVFSFQPAQLGKKAFKIEKRPTKPIKVLKQKKVELKDIEQKLDQLLGE